MDNTNSSSHRFKGLRHPESIQTSYHPVSPSVLRAIEESKEDPMRMVRISPVDGRYAAKMKPIAPYVCEAQLARMRMIVETEWFRNLFLTVLPLDFATGQEELVVRLSELMRKFADDFSVEAADNVAMQENRFKHDVIAMLAVLRSYLEKEVGDTVSRENLLKLLSMIHLGLTSEDVSSASHSMMISITLENVIKPACENLIQQLRKKAQEFESICDPTWPGKDLGSRYSHYADLIEAGAAKVVAPDYLAVKFAGATGTHAALASIANPDVDVLKVAKEFISAIVPNFVYLPVTAQINPHDDLALWCLQVDKLRKILQEICWEIWEDSGQDVVIEGELVKLLSITPDGDQSGSSAMPQKIQVILIENALGTATCFGGLAADFAKTINVNRLQRELSDSRIVREILGGVLPELLSTFQNMSTDIPKLQANPRCRLTARSLSNKEKRKSVTEDGNIDGAIKTLASLSEYFIRAGKRLADTPYLARTHNQPASPTTFGKELRVFAQRLDYLRGVLSKDLFGRAGKHEWSPTDILMVAEGILAQFFDDLRIYVTKRNGSVLVNDIPELSVQHFTERENAQSALNDPALLGKLLETLKVDQEASNRELEGHYESLGEAVQTILRRYGVWDAYERVKRVTRGATMDRNAYQEMVRELLSESPVDVLVPVEVQSWLLDLRPSGFTGLAKQLALR